MRIPSGRSTKYFLKPSTISSGLEECNYEAFLRTHRTRDGPVIATEDYGNAEMVHHALKKLLAFAAFRVRGRNTAQGSQLKR